MTTLTTVKRALRDGDTSKAKQMLARIIKEKPNADAWYLAAKLTPDDDKASAYLKRALRMNPQHQAARDMLAQRSGMADQGSLVERIVTGLETFGDDYPVVGPYLQAMPRQLRIAVPVALLFALLSIGLLIVGTLTGSSTDVDTTSQAVVLEALPERDAVTTDELSAALADANYSLTPVPLDLPLAATEAYHIQAVPTAAPVGIVYMYSPDAHLPDDYPALLEAYPDHDIMAEANLIAVVPLDAPQLEVIDDTILTLTLDPQPLNPEVNQ